MEVAFPYLHKTGQGKAISQLPRDSVPARNPVTPQPSQELEQGSGTSQAAVGSAPSRGLQIIAEMPSLPPELLVGQHWCQGLNEQDPEIHQN